MAELETPASSPESTPAPSGARGVDEIALELTKFIAVTTGYARGTQSSAGFSGKASGGRSPEEQADALLELFDKCRKAVKQEK